MTTENRENLYNFVAPPPRKPSPTRIFKNKERLQRIQKVNNLLKADHRTMGLAEIDPPQPYNFLRKKARDLRPRLFQSAEQYCGLRLCLDQEKRAPVSDHFFHDEPRGSRNFHLENVELAGRWAPFPLAERVVDSKNGHVVNLERTVLRPAYLGKKGFGKVPRCVQNFLDQAEHQKQEAQMQKSAEEQHRIQEIFDNKTRLEIDLKNAKDEWDEKNKEFLLLPVVTDTLTSKAKRYKLERDLALLEDEIASLQHHLLQAVKIYEMVKTETPQ